MPALVLTTFSAHNAVFFSFSSRCSRERTLSRERSLGCVAPSQAIRAEIVSRSHAVKRERAHAQDDTCLRIEIVRRIRSEESRIDSAVLQERKTPSAASRFHG